MTRARQHHNRARRLIEFRAVVHAVKRDKPAFIKRLQARCTALNNGCVVYRGGKKDGYPVMTFWHKKKTLTITAARVFLILKTCRPIPVGHDAGHEEWCPHRECVRHVEVQNSDHNSALASVPKHQRPSLDVPF